MQKGDRTELNNMIVLGVKQERNPSAMIIPNQIDMLLVMLLVFVIYAPTIATA